MMNKSLLFLSLIFSLTSFASVKIEEELYVPGKNPRVVRELITSGSVIVDHVTRKGFEIYGRKGLGKYLDQKKIVYFDQKEINKSIMSDFPDYTDMVAKLKSIVARRSNIMKLMSIGRSAQGRDLWVVKISDNVNSDEVEPEFKYISSMHGDEITGREMMVTFIDEIGAKYGADREITDLVNNTEIYIMPSMNPDGSELHQRGNAKGQDLNRNFPDITSDHQSSPNGRQVETQLVMKFQESRQFALSVNFHGGSLVMNYPWDSKYERFPMDAFAQELATIYAQENPEMRSSSEFKGGITNGADWYIVKGGMQDWSYFWFNDLQMTVEISEDKWPEYSEMPAFYKSNRDSFVSFMKQVHRGAGFRTSQKSSSGKVTIKQVSPRAQSLGSFAYKGGEFYKVLPEGDYEFVVEDKVLGSKTLQVRVEKDSIKPNGNYITL
jgi:hypothetical protein